MTFRKTVAGFCRGFADALDPPAPEPAAPAIEAPAVAVAATPSGPGPQVRIAHEMLVRSYLERALRPHKPPETFVS